MYYFKFWIYFYLTTICTSSLNNYLRREHSLTKPYADNRWIFRGSTVVTNSHVRLTPNQQSRKGTVWNIIPCMLKNWELHLNFKVSGPSKDYFGDGIAVWYTRNISSLGPVFGNEDYFYGLGLFMDTYQNHAATHSHGHPYISAMVNDGTQHYDHSSDGTHTEVAGCEAKFRNVAHDTFLAIRYEKNKLTVSTDVLGKDKWVICFSVSGVHLPTGLHFGATATTGELSDNHDIISMKIYDIGNMETDEADNTGIIPHIENLIRSDEKKKEVEPTNSSFSITLSIIFIVVCLIAIIVYFLYHRQHKTRLY